MEWRVKIIYATWYSIYISSIAIAVNSLTIQRCIFNALRRKFSLFISIFITHKANTWRSRAPDGVQCAHFPTDITAIINVNYG
jgi:hypothetical protein